MIIFVQNTTRLLPFFCLVIALACSSVASNRTATRDAGSSSARSQQIENGKFFRIADSPTEKSGSVIQCLTKKSCWIHDRESLWNSEDGGDTWARVYSIEKGAERRSYKFYSEQVGWATSSSSIYSTDDGGHNWIQRVTPADGERGEIHSLSWLDGLKTGWLAGGIYRDQTREELKYGVPNNTKDHTGKKVLEEAIFRTDDGGQHWQREQLSPRLIGRILGLRFFEANRGIALDEGTLWVTLDGGAHWKQPRLSMNCVNQKYLSDYYEGGPVSLGIIDKSVLLVAYSDGRIIKSKDGGRAWCDFVEPGQIGFEEVGYRYMKEMDFEDISHGWGLGWDRFLYETKDGGRSWSRVTSELRFDGMSLNGRGEGLLISEKGIYRLIA